eukprot:4198240-Amphidinium_carterae.1
MSLALLYYNQVSPQGRGYCGKHCTHLRLENSTMNNKGPALIRCVGYYLFISIAIQYWLSIYGAKFETPGKLTCKLASIIVVVVVIIIIIITIIIIIIIIITTVFHHHDHQQQHHEERTGLATPSNWSPPKLDSVQRTHVTWS